MRSRVLQTVSAAMLAVVVVCSGPATATAQPETGETPKTRETRNENETRNKWIAAGSLAGIYAALTTWGYFAWYYNEDQLPEFTTGGDGWFGEESYAGGSDKLGHVWGNMLLARETSEILHAGGWNRMPASLIAGGLSLALFTVAEINDGYYFEFSTADSIGNAIGAGLAVLFFNVPAFDDLVDFRVEYIPTELYLGYLKEDGDVNVVEDYTGQTYMLAFHVAGIPGATDSKWTEWADYVDVVLGFQSFNYKPAPDDPTDPRRQSLFFGVAVNMQHVLDRVFGTDPDQSGAAKWTHSIGHHVFEYMAVPFTTLRIADAERSPDN